MSIELPRFSIVIPTFNRPEPLRRCLEALAGLDYPADRYEVIVVDDGGHQPLGGLVTEFQDQLDIRLFRQANAGPGAARNTGAAGAVGDYLAFTDDDCRPEPGWLRAFAARFETRPDDLLGGRTLNGVSGNIYSEASQVMQAWFYDYCETRASPLRFFASNNLSLPAALFREMGGFDTATLRYASEDRELCGRWLARGYAMRYVPAALIRHYHHLDSGSFWRQHFAYGRGAFRLRQARRKMGLAPLPSDRRWLLESVFRRPLIGNGLWRGMALATLAFCTHAANLAGYSRERGGS
ncbi:glycosyltransferase [Methylomagnum sp.]